MEDNHRLRSSFVVSINKLQRQQFFRSCSPWEQNKNEVNNCEFKFIFIFFIHECKQGQKVKTYKFMTCCMCRHS